MFTTTEQIKGLWLVHKGDNSTVLKAIKAKEELPTEMMSEIHAFDSKYGSITIVDDGYLDVLSRWISISDAIENAGLKDLAPLPPQAPVLVRWNSLAIDSSKSDEKDINRIALLERYNASVFLLDDDIRSYASTIAKATAAGLNVLGYYSDELGYHLVDGNMNDVLTTRYPEELQTCALISCKFLLVGAKPPIVEPHSLLGLSQKTAMFFAYSAQQTVYGGSRVMAFPGRPGCFANMCLKQQNEPGSKIRVFFAESWSDVKEITGFID